MSYKVPIRKIEHINHNVLHIITEKPADYKFTPGQATEVSIDKKGWVDKKRPFTFTSLPEHDELEFTIKVYPSHDGVTEQLESLAVGDHLHIGEPWGAIQYKGEGTFIAGGAGVTPFIAILKHLKRSNQLAGNRMFFSNKEERDIIYKHNIQTWLGNDLNLILSEEKHSAFDHGHIDKSYLEAKNLDVSKPVYLCGPPSMMESVKADLFAMGLPEGQLVEEE